MREVHRGKEGGREGKREGGREAGRQGVNELEPHLPFQDRAEHFMTISSNSNDDHRVELSNRKNRGPLERNILTLLC